MYDVVGFERDGFTFDLLAEYQEDEARYIAKLQAESEAAEAAKKAEAKAEAAKKASATEGKTSPPEAGEAKSPGEGGS